jgi:hypothetical protein
VLMALTVVMSICFVVVVGKTRRRQGDARRT